MAKVKKINTEYNVDSFKPFSFEVQKSGKKLLLKSPPIEWNSLNEDQLNKQKTHCYNILWNMEKEGIISKDHLYNYFYTLLEKSGYDKTTIQNIKNLKDWQISLVLLKASYLISLGLNDPTSLNFFENGVKNLINLASTNTPVLQKPIKDESNKKTIQEIMAENLSTTIGELQGFEDEMFENKTNIMKWLQTTNVAKIHIPIIHAFFKRRLDEINEIESDEQVKEAYSCFSKKEIKAKIAWYETLLDDLDAYKRLKQSTQKVRIRKPKSPLKLVSKLKYKFHDEEINITSIKPETLIGKSVLWLYNTKTRKLCVYNASEMEKELTVKGTTVLGWDPKTSVGKTLRKPVEQIKTFMKGGKVAMRNFLEDIRAKEAKLNGRISKDILLLKVY